MCSEEHPDASRIDPPEGLAIPAVPVPGTLCNGRDQKPEDPSPRTPLRIKRPFAAVANPDPKILRRAAPPDPKALCCGCRSRPGGPSPRHISRPEDPLLWLQVQVRRPFAAPPLQARKPFAAVAGPDPKVFRRAAPPDPKVLCCGCRSGSEDPSLRRLSRSEDPLLRAPLQVRELFVAQ
jgi:hypothetical protein